MGENNGEVLFSDLSGDDYQKPTEIESLCLNCGKNGTTKLMLTRIPHYKEVILMSFNCAECGFSNSELQSGSKIQDKGLRIEVSVSTLRDLSRQVVKSDYATLIVPEIDLQIPPLSQKGDITTVEGILTKTIAGLEQDQPVRKYQDPEGYNQLQEYVLKIKNILELKQKFRIIVDDPSGNSFIENPFAPAVDPTRIERHYVRSTEQDHELGLYTAKELRTEEEVNADNAVGDALTEEKLKEEVLHFSTNCPDCNAPAQTNMKITNIPFFKEVVIMATICEMCDSKTNEVKSGGGIEPKGKKITLKINDPSDLNRDLLKSETCSISIPELEFEMGGGALGGRFTTVEGLMHNMLEEIEKNSIWGAGDATAPDVAERMEAFKKRMHECIEAKEPFTIILDDPAGNSYLQNIYAPEEDPNLHILDYERSYEQNEDLGLNDIKTENYQENAS
ncbi:zinc finger protein ZPR1 [Eurytemora carolleeae]|uniref:zinc finger protein ZPR1 n=1 Tax=Eurytemora carolleeae TaxID=1294199 RepID=UPI000C78073C|nr:zinc finger protein ZPR1 [Eurytemora carolleeae]|eukprot:XP_023338080.1 zinc finger protein ZPR1-like [Eurytemora affinis]